MHTERKGKTTHVQQNRLEKNNNTDEGATAGLLIKAGSQPSLPLQPPPPLQFPSLPRCQRCDKPIFERFFLQVGEADFHCRCLSCCECGDCLETAGKCYCRDGRLYCWEDYCRLFSQPPQSCPRCLRRLHPSDLVMRAGSRRFHLACFTCGGCQRQFAPGDTFGMDAGGEVYCHMHLRLLPDQRDDGITPSAAQHPGLKTAARQKGRPRKQKSSSAATDSTASVTVPPLPTSNNLTTPTAASTNTQLLKQLIEDPALSTAACAGNELVKQEMVQLGFTRVPADGEIEAAAADPTAHSMESSSDPDLSCEQPLNRQPCQRQQQQQRQKRVRTSFKHHQLRIMKAYFLVNHNPDSKDLKQLAQKTSLSKRVLQVWFQNARAKYRRSLLKPTHQQDQLLGSPMTDDEKQLLLHQFQQSSPTEDASNLSSTAALSAVPAGDDAPGAAGMADVTASDNDDEDSMRDFVTLHSVNCVA